MSRSGLRDFGDTDPAVSKELLESSAHRSLRRPSRGATGLTLDVLFERTRGHRETLAAASSTDSLRRARSEGESADRRSAPRRNSKGASRAGARRPAAASRGMGRTRFDRKRPSCGENRISHSQNLRHPGQSLFRPVRRAPTELISPQRPHQPNSSVATAVSSTPSLPVCEEAVTRDDVLAVRADHLAAAWNRSIHGWLTRYWRACIFSTRRTRHAWTAWMTRRSATPLQLTTACPSVPASALWHDRWFQTEPELVLDVLYQSAVGALRVGDEAPPGLNDLATVTDHEDVVHDVRLGLLRAISDPRPEKATPAARRAAGRCLPPPRQVGAPSTDQEEALRRRA